MGTKKLSYNEELKILKLETLEKRRTNLCLRFAKKCFTSEKSFPSKKYTLKMKTRRPKKYKTIKYRTKRIEKSSLPYMRALLNEENKNKLSFIKNSMK